MQINGLCEVLEPSCGPLPIDQPVEALLDSLLGLAKLLRDLWPEHTPLSWLQFVVLRRLAQADADVRLTGVTDGLGYDISVMSRTINSLVDSGLIDRQRDPADGRAWLLKLTDEGNTKLADASRRAVTVMSECLSNFGDADISLSAQLIATLNRQVTKKLRNKPELTVENL